MQPVSGATQSGALSTFGGVPRAVMCRGLPHAYTYTYGICAVCVCVGNTVGGNGWVFEAFHNWITKFRKRFWSQA